MPVKVVAFLSPTMPSFSGNGLAMRAAATLKLLSDWGTAVHLVVVPIFPGLNTVNSDIAGLCRTIQIVDNPTPDVLEADLVVRADPGSNLPQELLLNGAWRAAVERAVDQALPDLILVFRFYLIHFVEARIGGQIPLWLDIDELESKARDRLSHIFRIGGWPERGNQLASEAAIYRQLERRWLGGLARIFVASEPEAKTVKLSAPRSEVTVLPNIYSRVSPQKPREPDGKFKLLFVGNFGYYPNRDAISYFCSEVLPLIQVRTSVSLEIDIVGAGSEEMAEASLQCRLRCHGFVPDTSGYYADCDAVIVPIRVGGGTRIKIIEALSHQRAIVATTVGAEGLDLTDGLHLLLASSAGEFAEDCVQLIEDPALRAEIATRGHEYFVLHHTIKSLERIVSHL